MKTKRNGATPGRSSSVRQGEVDRSTSTAAQLQRCLEELRRGPTTTDGFRKAGVYQVSARIFELRKRGYNIVTHLFSGVGADGFWHTRMARYTLLGLKGGREGGGH